MLLSESQDPISARSSLTLGPLPPLLRRPGAFPPCSDNQRRRHLLSLLRDRTFYPCSAADHDDPPALSEVIFSLPCDALFLLFLNRRGEEMTTCMSTHHQSASLLNWPRNDILFYPPLLFLSRDYVLFSSSNFRKYYLVSDSRDYALSFVKRAVSIP